NGGNVTLTPSLNLPDFTASGNYFLLANVDGENDYSEVNESNNTTFTPVTVQAISYDFLIDTVIIADTLTTDSATTNSLSYTGTWSNQGTSPASSVRMRIYLSTDTTLDTGDEDVSWTSANFTGVSTQNLSGYLN